MFSTAQLYCDIASELANVAITHLKSVYCMIPVNNIVFLPSPLYPMSSGGSSSPSIHTPSSPPFTPYAMVSSLLSFYSSTTRLYFFRIPIFIPQRPEKEIWVVWDSHPLLPPSSFVTAAANPILSIFNS